MFAYARLTPGRGFRPGRALLYYAQRFVTLPAPRRLVARMIAACLTWFAGCEPAVCIDSYGARVLDELKREHRSAFGPRGRDFRPAALEARFGADQMHKVTGPRGVTFLADTLGVHGGEAPRSRARLLLQVQYSILPVFAFRYAPEEPSADAPAVDAYSNRLVVHRPAMQAQWLSLA